MIYTYYNHKIFTFYDSIVNNVSAEQCAHSLSVFCNPIHCLYISFYTPSLKETPCVNSRIDAPIKMDHEHRRAFGGFLPGFSRRKSFGFQSEIKLICKTIPVALPQRVGLRWWNKTFKEGMNKSGLDKRIVLLSTPLLPACPCNASTVIWLAFNVQKSSWKTFVRGFLWLCDLASLLFHPNYWSKLR